MPCCTCLQQMRGHQRHASAPASSPLQPRGRVQSATAHHMSRHRLRGRRKSRRSRWAWRRCTCRHIDPPAQLHGRVETREEITARSKSSAAEQCPCISPTTHASCSFQLGTRGIASGRRMCHRPPGTGGSNRLQRLRQGGRLPEGTRSGLCHLLQSAPHPRSTSADRRRPWCRWLHLWLCRWPGPPGTCSMRGEPA